MRPGLGTWPAPAHPAMPGSPASSSANHSCKWPITEVIPPPARSRLPHPAMHPQQLINVARITHLNRAWPCIRSCAHRSDGPLVCASVSLLPSVSSFQMFAVPFWQSLCMPRPMAERVCRRRLRAKTWRPLRMKHAQPGPQSLRAITKPSCAAADDVCR
jgi:hypothetical protein